MSANTRNQLGKSILDGFALASIALAAVCLWAGAANADDEILPNDPSVAWCWCNTNTCASGKASCHGGCINIPTGDIGCPPWCQCSPWPACLPTCD